MPSLKVLKQHSLISIRVEYHWMRVTILDLTVRLERTLAGTILLLIEALPNPLLRARLCPLRRRGLCRQSSSILLLLRESLEVREMDRWWRLG